MTLIQIAIALTTAIGLPIILNTRVATWPNRIGCLVALAGQPLWIYETLRAGDQPGQFIVAVWLTAWYLFGVVRPRPALDAGMLAYIDALKLPSRPYQPFGTGYRPAAQPQGAAITPPPSNP